MTDRGALVDTKAAWFMEGGRCQKQEGREAREFAVERAAVSANGRREQWSKWESCGADGKGHCTQQRHLKALCTKSMLWCAMLGALSVCIPLVISLCGVCVRAVCGTCKVLCDRQSGVLW